MSWEIGIDVVRFGVHLYRIHGFVLEGDLLPYFCRSSEFWTELASLADYLRTPLGQLHP